MADRDSNTDNFTEVSPVQASERVSPNHEGGNIVISPGFPIHFLMRSIAVVLEADTRGHATSPRERF